MFRARIAATTALAISIASLTPLAAHAASSGATTYYVSTDSTTCDDSGPGTQAEPFCTITAAAATATTPGDTVLIEPGDYGGELQVTASGTATDPITFAAASPQTGFFNVRLNPPTTSQKYGVYVDGASYVDISGIWLGGVNINNGTAVDVANSSHVTVSDLETNENVQVTGDSSDVTVSRVQAQGTEVGSAFDVDSSGTGNVLTTNLALPALDGAAGITVEGSPGAVITSNTVTQFCGAGIAIGDDSNGTASGATIENNVVEDAVTDENDEDSCESATTAGISVQSVADESGLTADYNDVYPADSVNTEPYDWAGTSYQTPAALDAVTGQGAADSIANPEVTPASGLVENESSPVINGADSDAPGELSTDFIDNARVYDPNVAETGAGTKGYDRGAYQYVETLTASNPVVPGTAPSGTAVTIAAPTMDDNWANATYTYTYDFGDGTADVTTSDTTVTHTYAAVGTYNATLVITSDYGDSVDSGFTIDILKPVTPAASVTGYTDYGLTVDPEVSVTTDWPVTSQTLSYGDGTTINITGLNESDLYHSYAEPGTYELTYTATDQGGDTLTAKTSFTTAGDDFTPITPTRLLDTADNLGGSEKQLANDGSLVLKVAGVDGIPADATAVDLNLTAVDASGSGYIQANTGTGNGTSTLNYAASKVYSNSVIAQISPAGTVTLENFATSKTTVLNLIADASGYFTASQADRFEFVAPARLMDTRSGIGGSTGALGAGKTDVLTVAGAGGLPATGVAAVAVNLTVTGTAGSGYLVAYADGTAEPGTSDENWQGSTTKATNAIVPVGSDGAIDLHNGSDDGGATDVLVDVTGYFTASTTGNVYVPVTPSRVLDTRKSSAIPADQSVTVNLADLDGVPGPPDPMDYPYLDQSVTGFVFNATATQTEQSGWLRVSDGATTATSTSTVNWVGSGQTVANLAISQDDISGASTPSVPGYFVSVYNGSPGDPVQALLDVMGYFTAS
jgi:hypothetical protein